ETRFFAALGHEIRLREALEEPASLEDANHRAEVVFLAEEEQIQEVAERELARSTRDRAAERPVALRILQLVESHRRKLLRRHSADRVLDARGAREERGSKLSQSAPADFSKADAQQHLVARRTSLQLNERGDLLLLIDVSSSKIDDVLDDVLA